MAWSSSSQSTVRVTLPIAGRSRVVLALAEAEVGRYFRLASPHCRMPRTIHADCPRPSAGSTQRMHLPSSTPHGCGPRACRRVVSGGAVGDVRNGEVITARVGSGSTRWSRACGGQVVVRVNGEWKEPALTSLRGRFRPSRRPGTSGSLTISKPHAQVASAPRRRSLSFGQSRRRSRCPRGAPGVLPLLTELPPSFREIRHGHRGNMTVDLLNPAEGEGIA